MSIEHSRFDNKIWGELASYEFQHDVKIFLDEKAFFIYLCHNERMNFFGLYPINRHQISAELGMDRNRIEDCLRNWSQRGFLVFDNGLIFIPSIGLEQKIQDDRYYKSILAKCLGYRNYTSEYPDSRNHAFMQFQERYYDTIKQFIESENAKHGKALHGELSLFTVNSANSQSSTENLTNSQSGAVIHSEPQSGAVIHSEPQSGAVIHSEPQWFADINGDSLKNGSIHSEIGDIPVIHSETGDFSVKRESLHGDSPSAAVIHRDSPRKNGKVTKTKRRTVKKANSR